MASMVIVIGSVATKPAAAPAIALGNNESRVMEISYRLSGTQRAL